VLHLRRNATCVAARVFAITQQPGKQSLRVAASKHAPRATRRVDGVLAVRYERDIGTDFAESGLMQESSSQASSAHQASATDGPTAFVPVTTNWTCPFCPLLCDDIELRLREDQTLEAPATDCARLASALARYGAGDSACAPSIDSAPVSLDAALQRSADLIADAHRPLLGGCATDVAGARALYELAASCGAILDSLHGDAMTAATLALQDRGAFFTTLSEVRSRADLLIVFACAPSERHPRFYERLAKDAAQQREICFVACDVDPAARQISGMRGESLLPNASPHDVLAFWSAIAEGRAADAFEDGSGIARELAALTSRVKDARYTAFVVEPGALPGPHAALLIEALHRIVKAIDRTSRAGVLTLGGADGALSVNQTVTWLSGFPLRTRVSMPERLAGVAPLDYDPFRYRTDRLLAAGEIDLLLWVASFEPHALPASLAGDVPAIVLGTPALASLVAPRSAPTVFIPVATPGIDSDGHLFRLDVSVVAPLHAARRVELPTVAALAMRLTDALHHARRPS
jgi:formylmethanofuran dehydrogenase subunit B